MPPFSAQFTADSQRIWQIRRDSPTEYQAWYSKLSPDGQQKVDRMLGIGEARAASFRRIPPRGDPVAAAQGLGELLGKGRDFLGEKLGEFKRGAQMVTGHGPRSPRPGPGGIPQPGSPRQMGASANAAENVLQWMSLGFVPKSKWRALGERMEEAVPALGGPRERPVGQAAKDVGLFGDALGMATWLPKAGPGAILHGAGALAKRALPKAAPAVVRGAARFAGEGAVLGAGHGAGALQEGATLAEAGKIAGQTTAAWMVAGPVLNKALSALAGIPKKMAESRIKAGWQQYAAGLRRQQGRAPSEAEGVAAVERLIEKHAPPKAPKAAAEVAPPRIMPPPEPAERAIMAEAQAAKAEPFRRPIEPKPPRPAETVSERMSAEADVRAEAALRADEAGIPRAQSERAISEAQPADDMSALVRREALENEMRAAGQRYATEKTPSAEADVMRLRDELRAVQREAERIPDTEAPGETFTRATGEPAEPDISASKPPGWTRTGGGRKRGAIRLPDWDAKAMREKLRGIADDAAEKYNAFYATLDTELSSIGSRMRSLGEWGIESMRMADEAFYQMMKGRGSVAVAMEKAIRPLGSRWQQEGAFKRVSRVLDGRADYRTLASSGERESYKGLRQILDDLEITGLEDGALTIRAREEFTLSDGTVIPKTPTGRDDFSNIRPAIGRYKSVKEMRSSNELDIQLVNPETAELLPTVYTIPQSRVRIPARDNFFPRRFDKDWLKPERRAVLEAALEKAGVEEGTAGDLISAWRQHAFDPWHGSFRLQRIADLPEKFYLPPEESLRDYVQGATRHIAWAREMGAGTSVRPEGWKFDAANKQAMDEGVETLVAKGWARDTEEASLMLLGRKPGERPGGFNSQFRDAVRMDFERPAEQDRGLIGRELASPLRSFTAITSLSRVGMTNLSQHANTVLLTGWKAAAEGLLKGTNKLTREEVVGLGGNMRHGLEELLGIGGDVWHQRFARFMINKGYALEPMENWLRTTAAVATRRHVQDSFLRLKANPGDAWSRSALELVRINPERALKRGHLTDDEILRAMFWGAGETQFLTRQTDMNAWYMTEGGKVLWQFLGFSYQQGKLMRNLVKRDFATKDPAQRAKLLGHIFVTMPAAGSAALGLKSLVAQKPRTSGVGQRYVENFFAGGGLGIAIELFWDALYASEHGDLFAAAGPQKLGTAVGDAAEIAGLTDLVQRGRAVPRTEKEAARADRKARIRQLKNLPVPHGLAGTAANMFFPPPSLADVPHWLRAEDAWLSVSRPKSRVYNIWEMRANWRRLTPKERDKHFAALSPGDRVILFTKLSPQQRSSWRNYLGPAGQQRFIRETEALGPKAVERMKWALQDAAMHKAAAAAEREAAKQLQPAAP